MAHNSMALAYAMKKKKFAEGGHVEEHKAEEMEEHEEAPLDHMDMYAMAKHRAKESMSKRDRAMRTFRGEEEAQYDPKQEPGRKTNSRASVESDRMLGQHGEDEVDDYGEDREDTPHPMDAHAVENQFGEGDEDEDMVGRIMHKRREMFAEGGMSGMSKPKEEEGETHMCSGGSCPHYSHGGEVANQDEEITDDMPAEYDDLHLDDSLNDDGKADYTGANSGDELDDVQEDHDRSDIVSRIMASRKKKDRMPRPA